MLRASVRIPALFSRVSTVSPETRNAVLGLSALFYLVFALNADSLRFSGGDWNTLANLRDLHGFEGFRRIVLNQWFSLPRIQFLNHLWCAAMVKLFGFWAAPYFAVILAAHFAGALLAYGVLRALGLGELAARGGAALYLVVPSSAPALFVIFYSWLVFPCTMLMLALWLALFPLKHRWLDLASLTAACLTCQFLGDQTIALLYWVLACLAARQVLSPPHSRPLLRFGGESGLVWPLIRLIVPALACAGTLALYWFAAVRPFATEYAPRWNFETLGAFVKNLLAWQAQAMNAASWMYGKASVGPSRASLVIIPAVVATLWGLFARCPAGQDEKTPLAPLAGCLAGGLVASVAPLLYAVLIGYRSGMETRYMYVPGLVLALLLATGIEAVSRRWPADRDGRIRKALFFSTACYLSMLMIYDLRDIWGAQKRTEERIWAQIDAQFPPRAKYIWERPANPRAKYIITDGLQHSTLMPSFRSNAVGDFFEDFGVQGRLRVVNGVDLLPVRRPRGEKGNLVLVEPYWQKPRIVDKSELFAIVFRYGAEFSDLERGLVLTFPSYDDYKRYRTAEGISFSD